MLMHWPRLPALKCANRITIRELAETVAEVVGYTGKFVQDTSKPDGTMCKIIDLSKISNLGWKPKIDLCRGIAMTYEDYFDRNKQ